MKPIYLTIAGLFLAVNPAAAEVFSINDALRQAMLTNPAVGEASANRRATQSELRQTQSTLLPQVRIEASYGPEKFDQSAAVSTGTAQCISDRTESGRGSDDKCFTGTRGRCGQLEERVSVSRRCPTASF